MKKLLYVSAAINIFSIVIAFLMLLSISILYAILTLALGILGIVPIFALISCLDTGEQNTADISYLYSKLKSIEKASEEVIPSYAAAIKHSDSPKKPWKCIKCDTVNKADDTVCVGCKAEYSYLNPTYDSEPKRKSRFVKFK